jgi:hypothetical protein
LSPYEVFPGNILKPHLVQKKRRKKENEKEKKQKEFQEVKMGKMKYKHLNILQYTRGK